MKLSVIMPAHNREALIEASLRSLVRQSAACDLDVIVIDDGSTDGTAARVEAMARTAPAIRLLRQQNRGVTRTRNAGLAALPADCELVTFLDSDDISANGHFAGSIARFREDPDLDVTYGMMTIADAIDGDALLPVPGSWTVTVRGIQLGAGIFRRRLIDRLDGFNEHFDQGEDTDFLFRLFERSPRVHFGDEVVVYYRRHAGNLTKDIETGRRGMMRALMHAVQRRRADPTLARLEGIFDVQALAGVKWL